MGENCFQTADAMHFPISCWVEQATGTAVGLKFRAAFNDDFSFRTGAHLRALTGVGKFIENSNKKLNL